MISKFKQSVFVCPVLGFALAAFAACSNATVESNKTANANANTAAVTNVTAVAPSENPTLNAQTSPAANSAIPGIPNAPANVQIAKNDLTRNAKLETLPGRPAPDNSEITESLGDNLVDTRIFKNNARIAKIERTTLVLQNNRKVVKVYLRNGQVRELTEDKIGDAMSASADNVLKALGANGASKPSGAEAKPEANSKTVAPSTKTESPK